MALLLAGQGVAAWAEWAEKGPAVQRRMRGLLAQEARRRWVAWERGEAAEAARRERA